MFNEFRCKRCGWCCRNIVISISYSDIIRWFNEGNNDVLREISFINNYPKKNTGGFYIAKTTFNPKQPCPFLEKNECSIYDTRPICCRDYPTKSEQSCIGCKTAKFNKKEQKRIRQEQYKDYKMAYDNWRSLLKILIESRRENNGN